MKFVGINSGLLGGEREGVTHQFYEDLGILSNIPNFMIFTPADAAQTYHAVRKALEMDGPVYVRAGSGREADIFDLDVPFSMDGITVLKEYGQDTLLLSSGFVLDRVLAAAEMLDYRGTGMSVMEMSHRSKAFEEIITAAEQDLRDLMQIPDNYKVLFLQGGASSQFAMVPMNLMTRSGRADFVITGQWANKAYQEASRYGKANIVASSKDKTFSYIPELDSSKFDPEADYFHICYNNTIYGTRFNELPDTKGVPIVADMSSCILSEPVDVSQYGLIYAGAQKNMGPAGLTVVIIREDLIGSAMELTPTMFNYKTHADNGSMYNTPPTYGIYILGLVLDWIKGMGGLSVMKERNVRKAELLYSCLDESRMFSATVSGKDRSLMNVPFVTGSEELDAKFVQEAKKAGLINVKGHRSVGGMRASIYNAMPYEGVQALCEFIRKFEAENA